MKFYMTKDSFFLVNVYGKTRIFFACTLYYIMFFCAEKHCGRNISVHLIVNNNGGRNICR